MLKTFGELDQETQQKVKYAKFKAADIIKALKEGRKPTPGPPGGDPLDEAANLEQQGDTGNPAVQDQPRIIQVVQPIQQHFPETPSIPPPVQPQHLNATAPAAKPQPVPLQQHYASITLEQPQSVTGPSVPFNEDAFKAMAQAQKLSKFAISALQYEDIPTALDNLQKAIETLKPFQRK